MRRHLAALALLCALGQYPATVVRVVDGDTIEVKNLILSRVIGPGCEFTYSFKGLIRFLDVWAPEPSKPGGPEATAWMRARLIPDEPICVEGTSQDIHIEAFTRPLLWVYDADGQVNAAIVAAGYATRTKP